MRTGRGSPIITDGNASLTAFGGTPLGGALVPLDPAFEFLHRLWTACAPGSVPLRVTEPASGGPLASDGPWSAILVCATVDASPYGVLRELTAAGATLPGPVACLTIGGGGLQGQHGRAWVAAPGNLHLSLAVPCDLDAVTCAPSLPMLAAVALCDAIDALAGSGAVRAARPGIKWVNDVVLGDGTAVGGGGKAGGVLTALRTEGPRVTTYFGGLALNLATAPALPPDPYALPPVCLAGTGPAPGLGIAARFVMERVLSLLATLGADGPAGLVAAYRDRSRVLGRRVGIWAAGAREAASLTGTSRDLPPPWRRGRVLAIGPDLALDLDDGGPPVRDGTLRLEPNGTGGPARA